MFHLCIVFLPFTNRPPNNYDTLYSVLLNQKTCFVTFDQPLYIKARVMVSSLTDPSIPNVTIRLGGFHLIMTFFCAIWFIMSGSGLKDLFSTVYASASVNKMLTGLAYARAVRGNIWAQLRLGKLILETTKFHEIEMTVLLEALQDINDVYLTKIQGEIFKTSARKFTNQLT